MSYDIHIARTDDWADSASNPISKWEVDTMIAADPELKWSAEDWVDMNNDDGKITRYFSIIWDGQPCFWWYRDRIECSGPNEKQILKMVKIARTLNAKVIGDDGERYEIRKSIFGKEKLVTIDS